MTTTTNPEPTELRAGDPWTWRRDDLTADYPASAWNLVYWFKNEAGGFAITASADGDEFVVDETSDDTEARAAGVYSWQARAENIATPSTRHIVASGTLRVLQNLFTGAAGDAYDGRSHARKVLAAVEAVIEGRATKDQQAYSIAGRALTRTPLPELLALRDRYRLAVAREDQAAGVPNNVGATAYVQFRRP